MVATGSMDTTAKLWDVESGEEACTLAVSVYFSILYLFLLVVGIPSASPLILYFSLPSCIPPSFLLKGIIMISILFSLISSDQWKLTHGVFINEVIIKSLISPIYVIIQTLCLMAMSGTLSG